MDYASGRNELRMYRRHEDESPTREQMKEAVYNMYLCHPTSGYEHLTPDLQQVYNNFEFYDIHMQ
eukprot:4636312-Amphidinium_carterae.1